MVWSSSMSAQGWVIVLLALLGSGWTGSSFVSNQSLGSGVGGGCLDVVGRSTRGGVGIKPPCISSLKGRALAITSDDSEALSARSVVPAKLDGEGARFSRTVN